MLLSLLLACTPKGAAPLPQGDPTRPDVVLVSIDTLRADHLSSYGHDRPTSPFIDSLATQGVRFAHARSPSPWTLPAHTTMLTGQRPTTHRVIDDDYSIGGDTPVLAESLGAAGYRRGAFVSTLYVSRLFGFQRGFDRFEDFGIHTEKENLHGDLTFDKVIDEALDWWSEQPARQPVFLFLHTYDVHYAYDPPEPYASMFDRPPNDGDPAYKSYRYFQKNPPTADQLAHQRAQYDESIRWVDDQLARLDEKLAAAGRTVRWVITADHGEEFGERGSWGHAHTLYAEQLHVPLIVAEKVGNGPGSGLPAGRVVQGAVGLEDIAPTIASWVDGAGPLAADGIDLGPVLAGAEPPPRPFLADTSRFSTNRVGLYQDGLRLEWDLKSGKAELFDPAADPREARDLAAEQPQDVARLQLALLEQVGRPWLLHQAGRVSAADSGRILWVEEAAALPTAPTAADPAAADPAAADPAAAEPAAAPTATPKRARRASLPAGSRFQVLPFDAAVSLHAEDGADLGPWKALGGAPPPQGAALQLDEGGEGPAQVELDDATRRALEALGYVQSEEDEDADGDEEAGQDAETP